MNVGTIQLVAKIDTNNYRKGASDIAKANKDIEKSSGDAADSTDRKWSKAAKIGLAAAVTTATALTAALTKAAMASWNQVGAVEQATVGLRAYEKDGNKVNAVLADLIKYARSDMGVLFNRKDLFQSAQMLKLNGVATEDLAKNVEILSRSVGLGLGNWQDLNSVVGRVVATGRLSGIEFDQLTQYGFKLDKSLRNTNLSATELFKVLDKGIPVDAMKGQARTIRGLGIRVETAFRGIGDAILGVDADTSKFVEGGLGDKLVKALDALPTHLKKVSNGIKGVSTNIKTFMDSFSGKDFKGNKDSPEARFAEFGKTARKVASDIASYLEPKLQALWRTISQDLVPALTKFWKELIQPLIPVLGTALVLAIGAVTDGLNLALAALTPLINFMANNKMVVYGLVGAFVALRTAMAISKAVSAFQAGTTAIQVAIASTRAKLVAFRALAMSPVSMGALGIGAALASIAMVYAALQSVRQAIKDVNRAANATVAANSQIAKSQQKAFDMINSGDPKKAKAGRQLLADLSAIQRYKGGPVKAGEAYLVGENRDGTMNKTTELFVPRTSGRVFSSSDLQQAVKASSQTQSSSTPTITINLSGIMTDSRAGLRAVAKQLSQALEEEMQAKGMQYRGA